MLSLTEPHHGRIFHARFDGSNLVVRHTPSQSIRPHYYTSIKSDPTQVEIEGESWKGDLEGCLEGCLEGVIGFIDESDEKEPQNEVQSFDSLTVLETMLPDKTNKELPLPSLSQAARAKLIEALSVGASDVEMRYQTSGSVTP